MVLEVVQWTVKPHHELEFEQAFANAKTILSSAAGYISHKFQKCLENPRKYILLVEWESLEDHTVSFRGSESYQEYRSILKPHYESGATMEHYTGVLHGAQ